MAQEIEKLIHELFAFMQTFYVYPQGHPKLKEGIERVYGMLKDAFAQRDELVIGIVGDEVAFEKEIFFELSKRFETLIHQLNNKQIERIVFLKNVTPDELVRFLKALTERSKDLESYQEYLTMLGVENIRIGKMTHAGQLLPPGAHGEITVPIKKPDHKEEGGEIDTVFDSFSNILKGEDLDFIKLQMTLNGFLTDAYQQKKLFREAGFLRNYDVSTFLHSVNVSLLSMYFVSALGYSKEEILQVGVAGLLHDMGKIAVSRDIIQKPGALTEEEFGKIKNHSQLGAKILLKYVYSLGVLPVVVALEHHVSYDLSGYPQLDYPVKPNIISSLVGICDFYDALRSRRAYKKEYLPEKIYEIMMQEKGKRFDPYLIDRFFQELGVYPVGTNVRLSDGSIAIVRSQNKEDIFRPHVEIISPAELHGTYRDLSKLQEISIKESVSSSPGP
ncbi:MAG: HD domain-containing protein [Candidatus Omnitrophica bacterium]|nr:HD domain-containing protein [Candidatus Omnitrophota bacterium]